MSKKVVLTGAAALFAASIAFGTTAIASDTSHLSATSLPSHVASSNIYDTTACCGGCSGQGSTSTSNCAGCGACGACGGCSGCGGCSANDMND